MRDCVGKEASQCNSIPVQVALRVSALARRVSERFVAGYRTAAQCNATVSLVVVSSESAQQAEHDAV